MATVAAVQMASGPNINANLLEVEKHLQHAAEKGADLVVLPENFAFMGKDETDKLAIAEEDNAGPIQEFLQQQAEKHRFCLVGGTIAIKTNNPEKVRSSCLLYSGDGERLGRYDKMHLFDVSLPSTSDRYSESVAIEAGDSNQVYQMPFGNLLTAVCYDLRFPELFRTQGIDVIAVPSAFTAETGKAHWEVLLRARAIENLSYVIAAAQGGFHVNSRETWGHSMIVDPWGNILDVLSKGSGIVVADINLEQQESIRKAFPVLEHQRIRCQ